MELDRVLLVSFKLSLKKNQLQFKGLSQSTCLVSLKYPFKSSSNLAVRFVGSLTDKVRERVLNTVFRFVQRLSVHSCQSISKEKKLSVACISFKNALLQENTFFIHL